MKQTDGLFHKIFKEIGAEYPEIAQDHWIIDIGAAKVADSPELFDVIVLPNLYGDILSDIAAEITGSVGLAGSSNIGEECAMFEAIHGSAPNIANTNTANPSGLLQGALLMLTHIGQTKVAENIQNAWLKTLEDGIHTQDIYNANTSKQLVGTKEFAEAVIQRLGLKPETLPCANYNNAAAIQIPKYIRKQSRLKELAGVDLFVHWSESDPEQLAKKIQELEAEDISLTLITNRGIKVWPEGFKETFCTDHWRCRFKTRSGANMNKADIIQLLSLAHQKNIDIIKTENLYTFDGQAAYSLGQGQ